MARKTKDSQYLPTKAEVEKYEMLSGMFHSVFQELKTFSGKKPDEPLNKFKVNAINRILTQIKAFLASQPTIGFLDILDEVTIPTNSDAIFVLAQYDAALDHFKDAFYFYDEDFANNRWNTKENPISSD